MFFRKETKNKHLNIKQVSWKTFAQRTQFSETDITYLPLHLK
jgi:hypothetical protein